VTQHQQIHEMVTLVKSGVIRFRLGTDRSQAIDVHPGEDWLSETDAYLRG
jgi:hypothetical protein